MKKKKRQETEQPKPPTSGVGSPIPGSRFFREFCSRCGEPMRVTEDRIGSHVLCGDCDPKHKGVGNPTPYLDDHDAFAKSGE